MLFRPDGKVVQVLSTVADLVALNLMALLCCIPIFTIGASVTAVYSCILKRKEEREGYLVKDFFKAFKENFKQSTIMWVGFLFIGIMYFIDFLVFKGMEGPIQVMQIVVLATGIVVYAVYMYAFPLQAYFVNPVKKTIMNATLLAVGKLPSTVTLIIINLMPLFLITLAPAFMLGVYILLGISAPAWFSSHFILNIFNTIRIVDKDGNEVPREEEE